MILVLLTIIRRRRGGGGWYSCTVLTILETILLEDLGSEGEDDLGNEGSISGGSSS
jgi:hypothetical protein